MNLNNYQTTNYKQKHLFAEVKNKPKQSQFFSIFSEVFNLRSCVVRGRFSINSPTVVLSELRSYLKLPGSY